MRGAMERMEAAARAWTVAVLEGTVDGVPLTRDQLRLGFTLFDWDGDGTVDPQNFSDTLLRLNPQKKAEYFRIAKESGVLGGMGSFESFCEPPLMAQMCRQCNPDRWHLGCILLKMPAVSLRSCR